MTWVAPLVGGILIGLSAVVLLAFNGRIAGISGIFNRAVFERGSSRAWQIAFLIGMIGAASAYIYVAPGAIQPRDAMNPWMLVSAGLLVGWGTAMGGGCTSGHGVCGLGRLSKRSMIAVPVFMVTAAITVYLTRHVFGVGA